ncbi:hypothetical protein B5P43_18380 [Bacillus sp. SRB_336]|nr:hypothetical protein B5P43_18380 [Bacillus sp. SRB_336]
MKRVIKGDIELKREYYSQPWLYFTPAMIEDLVSEYGEKPATTGEAVFMLHERLLDLLSCLPIIGRIIK